MNLTTARRGIAVVATASLLALGLSGCFFLPQVTLGGATPQPSSTAQSDAPTEAEVGACWRASYDDLAEWLSWEGDDPVSCESRHQSYTFYVGEFEQDVENPFGLDSFGVEARTVVADECTPAFSDFGIPDSAQRVGFYFFLPTESDWDSGDRSFRCDIAVTAIDSDYYAVDVMNLPDDIEDLIADVAETPARYELCLSGDAFGPYESTQLYTADCTLDYDWRFGSIVEYPSVQSDPLPSSDELFDFADEQCALVQPRGDESVFPYVPTLAMWNSGDRTIECWFSTLDRPISIV